MKKVLLGALILILFTCLLSCTDTIKEYKGKKIVRITYVSADFNGGTRRTEIIDFNENTYSHAYFVPDRKENEPEIQKTFAEEEEKTFINACYTYGLFDLEESYVQTGIIDGGSWKLTIEYEDGSTKGSKGVNARPDKVFDKCSTVFYDLCGAYILGNMPENYRNSEGNIEPEVA